MSEVDCVLKIRSILGEGPLWHAAEQRLYWLDLRKPAIYCFDPATGRNTRIKATLRGYVGAMVVRARGGMIVADQRGLFALDPTSGRLKPFARPVTNMRRLWFNDAKCDPQGNFWSGVGDRGETRPTGIFFRIDAKGRAKKIDDGFICPNGPAFSPDGRNCYFADSCGYRIYRYEIDPATGKVGRRQPFATVPVEDGMPDGMTVDAEGGVWSCHWDGWRVTRYGPDGRIERVIKIPAPRPTSVAFGGSDYRTLYITSASLGLTRQQLREAPLSGSMFACQPGSHGLPEPMFAG
jgi:sugar lactone lactonase YvrE